MLVPVFFLVGFKGGQGLSLSFSLVALLFFNKRTRKPSVATLSNAPGPRITLFATSVQLV
jgi:hypothetical protein